MAPIKLVLVVMVGLAAVTMVSGRQYYSHYINERDAPVVGQLPLVRMRRDAVMVPVVRRDVASPHLSVMEDSLVRVQRDSGYGPPVHHQPVHHEPSYKPNYKPGKVGPVYTFVKTDYNGNFKWGVRHRAGTKYAGGYH